MDEPRSNTPTRDNDGVRRTAKRTPAKRSAEDVLEELHQLAGNVAAVFDSRKPEENKALESFEEVMDALENKVN